MPDTKVSGLPAATAALGADLIPVDEAGTSKSVTLTQVGSLVNGWFNVKNYGAVGNNSTDDTTAIQATINAAIAAFPWVTGMGGAVVYFPPGKYVTSSTLTINPGGAGGGLTLKGSGMASTIIRGTVAGAPVVSTYTNGTGTIYCSNTQICDMEIMQLSTAASSTALRINQFGRFIVQNVGCYNGAAAPVITSDAGTDLYIQNCSTGSTGATWGIETGKTLPGSVNSINIQNTYCGSAGGGMHFYGASALAVTGCDIEGSASTADILLDSCEGVSIMGNYFENNATYHIVTSAAYYGVCDGIVIGGNYLHNPTTGFMSLQDATNVTVLTNTLNVGASNANPTGITQMTASGGITILRQSYQNWGSGTKISFTGGNIIMDGFGPYTSAGVPSSGFLNGVCQKGGLVTDYTNGKLYLNTGTLAATVWTVVGTQT